MNRRFPLSHLILLCVWMNKDKQVFCKTIYTKPFRSFSIKVPYETIHPKSFNLFLEKVSYGTFLTINRIEVSYTTFSLRNQKKDLTVCRGEDPFMVL